MKQRNLAAVVEAVVGHKMVRSNMMTVKLEEMNHAPAEAIKNLKNVVEKRCKIKLCKGHIFL